MKSLHSIKPSDWFLYASLVAVCTSPVWGVAYFVNQDGSAHVESAYLIAEILRGNPVLSETYVLNSICIPNLSVHLILALLLQFFSAFTATKIVVCSLFAGVVAAVSWLRLATVGIDGIKTSLLIGAAIGFNWLWLSGSYNFIFSVIIFAFTVGVYWTWRENLNIHRSALLILLFSAAYFSHIIGFLILAGSVITLALGLERLRRYQALSRTLICLLPFAPLAIWYRVISDDGSPASPVWRSLADPYSLTSWFTQIRSADAFGLISKTAFPFVEERSIWFAALSPVLWMATAFTILLYVTVGRKSISRYFSSAYFPFAALLLISIMLAMFAPDDFGLSRGGIIRERIVICGLLFCVPLFRADSSVRLKRIAQFCLLFVVSFQTLALWEYSLNADKQSKVFMSASELLSKSPASATITITDGNPRFHAAPIPQLNCYNGIGTNNIVWDNYEFGHYLFPLITKNIEDQHFIHEFTSSNYLGLNDRDDAFGSFDVKLGRLNSSLESYNDRIETIALWGRDPRVEALITRWFEAEPYFENGKLRLFHHKK